MNFKAKAHLEENTWKMVIERDNAIVCDDGSSYSGTSTWTWDPKTLEGMTSSVLMVNACNMPAGFETPKMAFTLTKQSSGGPPPGFRTS